METDRLAELIEAKREVLAELRSLARRQLDVIAEADMTRLFSLLAAKQTLVENLNGLEQSLNPFRQQDPEARVWRTPQLREQCRETSLTCESLLKDVLLLEKQGETQMLKRREEIAHQLDGAHAAASAAQAYGAASSGGGSAARFDLSSE